MRNILTIAFLAFLVFSSSFALVLADEDEGDESEQEGPDEDSENENRTPGFEAALAFACSLVAARLLGKTG